MASIELDNLVIREAFYSTTTSSRIVVSKNQYKITIEKSGHFPGDLKLREDGEVKVTIEYTPA